MNTLSYTAANAFPVKLFKDPFLTNEFCKGKIIPVHVQINPTNRCNLKCSFCSCSKRDKKLSMDFKDAKMLIKNLAFIGCKAVTITGGGEPLLYPKINELIKEFYDYKIQVGLVTNGILLHSNLNSDSWGMLKWCRISATDERPFKGMYILPDHKPDMAFSYVLTRKFNLENLIKYIDFANRFKFCHVRVVPDIMDSESIDIEDVKLKVRKTNINDSLVIYQDRKTFKHGQKNCFISLLKPNIGPDGYLYPCCGVQYALKNPSLDYAESMRMGHMSDILNIYRDQTIFNGSVCNRCYYSAYNESMGQVLSDIQHKEFV
jgi:MoaA/NifB/PqqE/SkfB family radical SAM enzyme